MKNILVTTGDDDGVGLEITLRALKGLRSSARHRIFVALSDSFLAQARRAIQPLTGFSQMSYPNFFTALEGARSNDRLVLIASRNPPAHWVEEAAQLCFARKAHAMVTGPLSKPAIKSAGLKDLGHTQILSRITGKKELFMSFWGPHFNVVLMTGHLPLSQVPKALTESRLRNATELTQKFLKRWNPRLARKPLALLGINPHASDQGLIGKDDLKLKKWAARMKGVKGPLPADSAFLAASDYSAFLAAYHDQGLIAFKLAHGFTEGVHVTLGLPFLRTSVDHGPAKDLLASVVQMQVRCKVL